MKAIIYPKAGKIALAKYNPDGTISYTPDKMVLCNGTVQSIAANVNIATTELADGNADFPMGVYDTGKSGQIVVTMSSFQPALYAALMGSAVEELADSDLWSVEEELSIPTSSPYSAPLQHTPKATGAIVLVDADASPFVKVSNSPAKGQFAVSNDVATFNSADAGKNVFITYEWVADEAIKLGLPVVGARPVVQAIISTEVTDEEEINVYDANIIVDKCKATGDINQPTQQREPQSWSFTLGVLKPRPGYNPVYWKYALRS